MFRLLLWLVGTAAVIVWLIFMLAFAAHCVRVALQIRRDRRAGRIRVKSWYTKCPS